MAEHRTIKFSHVACALGLSIDLAEYALGSVLAAYFVANGDASDISVLPWLLSSVYVGAIVGASISGILCDIFGRRRILTIIMFFICFTSLATFFAPNAVFLTVFRFLSGIFLGAYPPLMSTYIAEISPAPKRGRSMMNVVAMGACGPVIIILLVHYLSQFDPFGIVAWRWGFFVCSLIALICCFLFLRMPESPKWLRLMGREHEAEDAERRLGLNAAVGLTADMPGAAPLTMRPRNAVIFLLSICFVVTWSTIGFPLLIGSMLIAKGIDLQSTLLFTATGSGGVVVGVFLTGVVIDKFERKFGLLTGGLFLGVAVVLFSAASSPLWLVTTAIIFQVLVAMILPLLTIYATELVPTSIRGRVTSWTWAARGAGAALAPFVLLPALDRFGMLGMSAIILSSLLLFSAIVAIFGPRGHSNRALS